MVSPIIKGNWSSFNPVATCVMPTIHFAQQGASSLPYTSFLSLLLPSSACFFHVLNMTILHHQHDYPPSSRHDHPPSSTHHQSNAHCLLWTAELLFHLSSSSASRSWILLEEEEEKLYFNNLFHFISIHIKLRDTVGYVPFHQHTY